MNINVANRANKCPPLFAESRKRKQQTISTGDHPDLGLGTTLRQNGARFSGIYSSRDVITGEDEEKRSWQLP